MLSFVVAIAKKRNRKTKSRRPGCGDVAKAEQEWMGPVLHIQSITEEVARTIAIARGLSPSMGCHLLPQLRGNDRDAATDMEATNDTRPVSN